MDARTIAWGALWVLLAGALLLHLWLHSRLRVPLRFVWSLVLALALLIGWGGIPLRSHTRTAYPNAGTPAGTRTVTRYLPGVARTTVTATDNGGRIVRRAVTTEITLPVVFLITAALYAALVPLRRGP
ncbi:MAG TPA: hypothetical protein VJ957_12280 [Longimicrobiales bacterium]|nr:hypothetical protein [Longimicrobiales bacterium]